MIGTFLGITWAGLSYLVLLPVVIILIVLQVLTLRKRKRVARLLAGSMGSKILVNFSPAKSTIKMILSIVGFSFIFLAILRPQWNKKEEIIAQEGRDLFVALDISRSMLAKDISPNRLAFAKAKIKSLVSALSCERVGLILFAGTAFVQCPLTADYNAFTMFLDQIDAQTISSGTTALDGAIKKALAAFKNIEGRKNKLLVIFTDGEDFSSNLAGVKTAAARAGMHIFTLGVGTAEGAPIPLIDEQNNPRGHQLDKNGTVVISRLNEGILYNLSQDSGGMYLAALPQSNDDIATIVHAVEGYEKERYEDKKMPMLQEQYPWFVGVSLFCFLLEWML
jgi:Ca-activated chloride channel family protein